MKLSDLKILTIDDSPMIQMVIKNILTSFDIGESQIYQACDGTTGLDIAETHHLDLVLCDLSMQPVDGFEFVRRLRNHERESLRGLPVVILTVHGEAEIVSRARNFDIDGYLLKPIAPKTLRQRLINVLQKREVHIEA